MTGIPCLQQKPCAPCCGLLKLRRRYLFVNPTRGRAASIRQLSNNTLRRSALQSKPGLGMICCANTVPFRCRPRCPVIMSPFAHTSRITLNRPREEAFLVKEVCPKHDFALGMIGVVGQILVRVVEFVGRSIIETRTGCIRYLKRCPVCRFSAANHHGITTSAYMEVQRVQLLGTPSLAHQWPRIVLSGL